MAKDPDVRGGWLAIPAGWVVKHFFSILIVFIMASGIIVLSWAIPQRVEMNRQEETRKDEVDERLDKLIEESRELRALVTEMRRELSRRKAE